MQKFSIGADPEVFVGNEAGLKSIVGTIGGTKTVPLPLPLGKGYAVQEDNVALEFNIPAARNKRAFVESINLATGFLEKVMKDSYGLQFVKESAAFFPIGELMTREAQEFGCDPDYNAWTGQRNPRPKAPDATLRSCGGHVHVGTKLDMIKSVRACDLYMGVPSVLVDKGDLRKQLYGKAGAFRKKPFGFEYRTLSNFWIFDPTITGWIYDQVGHALDSVDRGVDLDDHEEAITTCINNNDKDLANYLINKFNVELPNAANAS
jgi:Phage phiEco32-like COOH.NH2 ligase-type 2